MDFDVITGVTEKRGMKAFRPILGIGLKCDGVNGTDSFSTVRAEVRLVDGSKGNDETIIPDIKVKVLAEHAAKNNGQYYLKSDLSDFDAFIDLTQFAGIDLNSQKHIVVNLYGLVATATYTVRGIDADEIGGYFYRWSKMNIQASSGNQTMNYKNEKSEVLVLPLTNFVEVNMIHKNGGSKRWTADDCKKYMMAVNPIVRYNESGAVVCGYDSCIVLDIDNIQSYEITTDGTAYEFYTVDAKAE